MKWCKMILMVVIVADKGIGGDTAASSVNYQSLLFWLLLYNTKLCHDVVSVPQTEVSLYLL